MMKEKIMKNQRLVYLFACNLVILFVGMGLFPLLPLYAAQFGATPTVIGLYYAVMYIASVAGTIATGWLAQRFPPKGLFAAAGGLGVAALVLLGQATALWQVVLLTALIWFGGAIGIPLVGVLTGKLADGSSRGKSFTLMYLAYPLGAVLGGTTVGRLVAWQGYPLMFVVLGAVWAIFPIVGLLAAKDEPVPGPASSAAKADESSVDLGRTFFLLLIAFLFSAIAVSTGRLGTSLSMQALSFSPGAVASTATVSGLVTIPVALLIGALSDRLGRKRFLMLGYLLAAGGALTLSMASELWHFWLAATLMMVAFCTNFAVASALATDMLPPEALSRGLPRLSAMDSIASVLSFAGTGYVIDTWGATPLYLTSAVLALIAVLQLARLQSSRAPRMPVVAAIGPSHTHPFRPETRPIAPQP
jgi:MFS family permease